MERVVTGLKSYHLYAALVVSASHLSPSPPSLSYSLSSISTGSLVRRSLDLGCEARGVRRTLGAWAAEPVARGAAALCFLHGRARRGASSAAARGKAREQRPAGSSVRGGASRSEARRPAALRGRSSRPNPASGRLPQPSCDRIRWRRQAHGGCGAAASSSGAAAAGSASLDAAGRRGSGGGEVAGRASGGGEAELLGFEFFSRKIFLHNFSTAKFFSFEGSLFLFFKKIFCSPIFFFDFPS